MKHIILFVIFCVYFANSSFGQEKKIYVNQQEKKWKDFSKEVEIKNGIRIFYDPDSVPNINIIVKEDSILLEQVLKNNFGSLGLKVTFDNQGNVYLFKNFWLKTSVNSIFKTHEIVNTNSEIVYNKGTDSEYLRTYQDFISENIVIGSQESAYKNSKAKVSGFITNASDGSPIPQARLRINELDKYFVANTLGYYEIIIKPGEYTVSVNSLGMYERSFKLTILSNGQLNIPLQTKSFLLDEAVVSANRSHNVRSTNMGFEKISATAIKELPVILGEQDIVKIALLLPGVQTVGEASAGFNVRGSPADQNMFYINDLPVYNSSHIFGLFTTFNSDAINEFNFYKSNIPIEYGGQLSSIFEIDAKEGNKKNFSTRGGIGPTSARVLIEGPIKKDSSSYIVSFRSTYSDWILKQIDDVDIMNSSASFYDALADFSFYLNKKNNLEVFFYGSKDHAKLAFGIENYYSNLGSTIKWTHYFNKNFTSELDLIKSQYAYDEENFEIEYLGYKQSFDLNHNEAKLKFRYFFREKHTFQFGLDSKYYKLNYGDLLPLNDESSRKQIEYESENALANSIFAGDKWDITNKLSIEGGVRGTVYSYLGPKTIYSYEPNSPRVIENITDTTVYNSGDFIKNYYTADFRVSGKYEITNNFSVKASYNMLHQFIYMMSNTISVSPTNKWKLSDPHIKPMKGEQYSLGLYKNFWKDKLETSVEFYYKDVKNLVEYKDGAEFIENKIPETNIIQGDLTAYGLEFMLKKKTGKLNGWLNYTYSKSEVTVFDKTTGEMNNRGIPYPANYDKPHAFNLTFNYKLTKRIGISSSVVYSTGRPITYPTSIYYLNGIQITGFSGRNEYRMPDYFRTDLSINIEGNLKKDKLAHSSWSISFYNLTARKNPYTIVFENADGMIKAYEVSILGTIIPSINYNLKFGNYED